MRIRQRLLDGMVEFMELDEQEPGYDCGYAQGEIDACFEIIDTYIRSIADNSDSSRPKILSIIQSVVEKLNSLNNSCNGCLIETDQREDLCELILFAARRAGLETDDDVTEKWREW